MSTPSWDSWLYGQWAPGIEGSGWPFPSAMVASNVITGSNPPFTIQDYFAMYPKWAGPTLTPAPTYTSIENNNQITLNAADTALAVGQPVAGQNIPDGTFITAISGATITLSNPATGAGSALVLTVWNATLVPVVVILAYITLASASLVQARWQDSWIIAIGWFVSHFLTLYALADGNPTSTIGEIAAQGISTGIAVGKSAGDLSINYQAVQGIEDWGAWNLTIYGQMLATQARVIGTGPMLLW